MLDPLTAVMNDFLSPAAMEVAERLSLTSLSRSVRRGAGSGVSNGGGRWECRAQREDTPQGLAVDPVAHVPYAGEMSS